MQQLLLPMLFGHHSCSSRLLAQKWSLATSNDQERPCTYGTIMLYNLKEHRVIKYACAIADGRTMKNDAKEQVVDL